MGATHSIHPSNHILMQFAITKIRGDSKRYRQARILFDTGSQRTFITQDTNHKLELKTIGKELLDVFTQVYLPDCFFLDLYTLVLSYLVLYQFSFYFFSLSVLVFKTVLLF